MNYIAHRGYKTKYIKENTMESFINAFNNDFIGIEFDIRYTKDKEVVVCHDAFINRTSDGKGLVKDFNYKDLLKYNFGTEETPSKIPLFKDVLKKYKGIKVVELKERIDLTPFLKLIDDETYFISFDTSYILKLKNTFPTLKFGILNYGLNSIKDYDLDLICILDSLADKKIINNLLNRGVKVFIYGIIGEINYKDSLNRVLYIVNKK